MKYLNISFRDTFQCCAILGTLGVIPVEERQLKSTQVGEHNVFFTNTQNLFSINIVLP